MNIDERKFTEEKSFGKLVLLSCRLSSSWITRISLAICLLLLLFNAYYFPFKSSSFISLIRTWSEFGLSFSISTMGFLIAGYTIFATLSNPKMMVAMMGHVDKNTNIPTLKYNHLAFIRVFIHFMALSFIFLAVTIFGHSEGIVGNLIGILPYGSLLEHHIIKLSYAIVGTGLFYMLLLLRVFIFNVYTVVMNSLRWEYRVSRTDEEGE